MNLAEDWNDKRLNTITGYHTQTRHNPPPKKKDLWFTLKEIETLKKW